MHLLLCLQADSNSLKNSSWKTELLFNEPQDCNRIVYILRRLLVIELWELESNA